MTEFPELQAALVDAASRRYGRRRRPVLRPVGAALVAAAVAAAAIVAVTSLEGAPDVEEPAPPAKPVVRLEQRFEVFRRPPTAADRMPGAADVPARVHPKRARLVAQLGDHRVFLVPAGRNAVCLVDFTGDLSDGSECGPIAGMSDERNPPGQFGPDYVEYVFPDGVHDVRLTLADGRLVEPKLRDNAIIAKVDQAPYSLTWLTASDDLYGILLDRVALGRPVCSDLQRPSGNAEAAVRSSAQLAALAFYPGITSPKAVSVTPAGANAGGCGERTAGRVFLVELRFDPGVKSASLSQGRVLVGRANGRFVVWQP